MAPKASTSNNTPSAILADAVNAFTKAASLAFAAVEEEAKIEVARAQAEVADMRREHSKNMKFMNKTQLQEKDWERQGEMLKTSLEKSELTIKHQAETIVQLRDEVMQWKSQLETARRELQDWKDQYLRTEQERSRLSSRVDELMAEQLQNATQQTARASTWIPEPVDLPTRKQPSNISRKPRPSVPNVPSDDDEEPMPPPRKAKSKPSAAQNGTDRERTYVEPHPPAKEPPRDAPVARPKKRPSAVVPRAPPTPRASAPRNDYPDYQAPSPPRPQFIRRVHAIVEVPVKEEMNSDEENALASDDSEWQPSKKAENLRSRRSSIKSKPYVEIDEEDDDDDDQLLIGAEEDPNEIYGTRRVLPEDIRPTPKSSAKNTSGSNKKRKLDADSSNAGRAVAKVVRKK